MFGFNKCQYRQNKAQRLTMNRCLTDAAGKSATFVDVGNGFLVSHGFPSTPLEKCKEYFDYLPNFKCRTDDVMLLSWPKSGSNWIYEIILRVLSKTSEVVKSNKIELLLEFQPQAVVDSIPSPRLLNTHVPYRFLPKELKEKNIKTVMIVRNPKDTLVSLYHHVKGFREHEYDGEWKDFLQLYMQGEMMYGKYSDYLKGFEEAAENGIGFPYHEIHYEDLKQNGVEEVKKLARFLEVDIDEELCAKIMERCTFETMAREKPNPEGFKKNLLHRGFDTYRKGQVGDWKNWFTVAQNEQFDSYWKKEMEGSKMTFTYSPSRAK